MLNTTGFTTSVWTFISSTQTSATWVIFRISRKNLEAAGGTILYGKFQPTVKHLANLRGTGNKAPKEKQQEEVELQHLTTHVELVACVLSPGAAGFDNLGILEAFLCKCMCVTCNIYLLLSRRTVCTIFLEPHRQAVGLFSLRAVQSITSFPTSYRFCQLCVKILASFPATPSILTGRIVE